MKREDIENAVEQLDDDIIAETYKVRSTRTPKKLDWKRWTAAAACAVLLLGAGIWAVAGLHDKPDASLPMIELTENAYSSFGFEGYMAYDISELVTGNPWSERSSPDKLPVYKNPNTLNRNTMQPENGDFATMQALALDIAGRLGIDEAALELTDDAPDEETRAKLEEKMAEAGVSVSEEDFAPTKVEALADGVRITVEPTLTATVVFDPAIELPGEYNFSHYASYEENCATAEYLQDKYAALIGIDRAVVNVTGGDYNIYRDRMFCISFYEGGRSLSVTERIINFNFRSIDFLCNDESKLFLVRFHGRNLTEKLGDYPIISVKDAKKLLLDGHYVTNAPYEFPGEKYVAKVELVYRTGKGDQYFLPYYRFYVELPEMEDEDGLKDYGAYYVPAIEGRYIENMPLWDGSFNS